MVIARRIDPAAVALLLAMFVTPGCVPGAGGQANDMSAESDIPGGGPDLDGQDAKPSDDLFQEAQWGDGAEGGSDPAGDVDTAEIDEADGPADPEDALPATDGQWDTEEGDESGGGADTEADAPCDTTCLICGELNGCGDLCASDELCDDGIDCTVDTCVTGAGGCHHEPLAEACSDGNGCTSDYCDPEVGCVNSPNQLPCDDLDACTLKDLCVLGSCKGGEARDCDDGNLCTEDSCAAPSGCVHDFNSLPCDDASECTVEDMCSQGKCVGVGSLDCDDDNPCTVDYCYPDGGCAHEFKEGPCSDGDACTTGDKCVGGLCIGGAALVCGDNNPCTSDECDAAVGCINAPVAIPCDDENACTVGDSCQNGECIGGAPATCGDGNPCTQDSCNPQLGCVWSAANVGCDDNDPCTLGDWCIKAECVGTPMVCEGGGKCVDGVCSGPPPLCPPTGPYGSKVGSYLPDVALTDCDGNVHTIHGLCGFNASWFFTFAGW